MLKMEFLFLNLMLMRDEQRTPTHHQMSTKKTKLAPQVHRILYVKNLPYKITGEQMYEIFGKFGALRQVRLCA
jgi:RNA recognition motif-containing protein